MHRADDLAGDTLRVGQTFPGLHELSPVEREAIDRGEQGDDFYHRRWESAPSTELAQNSNDDGFWASSLAIRLPVPPTPRVVAG